MTGQVCAASHTTTFLEQVTVKGRDSDDTKRMALLKALNGVSQSDIVRIY